MPINITTLPVGSYVKDPSTLFNGVPIKWRILDFNHSGYPTGTATLFAWNAKRNVSVVPDTTTRVDKTFRDIPITASSGGGKIGNHLDTFYENLGSKLKAKVVDTPLDIGYSGGYAAYSTSFKKENHKIFLFGAGEYNYGSSTYLSRPTTQKYFANMATPPTLLYQALGLVTTDQPILSRDIKVSTSDYYCLYPGYIYGTSGDYATGQNTVNIFPMMNISTTDLTVLDERDADGSYILNLTENKLLIQDGSEIKSYQTDFNKKIPYFDSGYAEFTGLGSQLVNKSLMIAFWVKTTNVENTVVLETNLENAGYHFQISAKAVGNIHFGTALDAAQRVFSKKAVTDGQWHHVCGTFDVATSKMSIYVDGVQEGSITNSAAKAITGMTDLIAGSRKGTYGIKGNMSQVLIWNRVLTDTEILSLTTKLPSITDSAMVAYFLMEEGHGSTLIDSSGKIQNGALKGVYDWSGSYTPNSSRSFISIGDAPATKTMFDQYGMKDFSQVISSDWDKLNSSSAEILCWTDEVSATTLRYLHRTVVPNGILLKMIESITVNELQSIRLDSLTTAGASVKIAISGDDGVTWHGSNGLIEELTIVSLSASGYSASQLNALSNRQLNAILKSSRIRIALFLEKQNVSDTLEVKALFATEVKYLSTPTVGNQTVTYELAQKQTPSYFVSKDDGLNWLELKEDELTLLTKMPAGNKLRIKVKLQNGIELHGLSYSWG